MKVPIKCNRPDCPNTFVLDTEKWPPQRYCSKTCPQYVRTKKWRAEKAKEKPQDGTSGTSSAGAQEPHEDKPGS